MDYTLNLNNACCIESGQRMVSVLDVEKEKLLQGRKNVPFV